MIIVPLIVSSIIVGISGVGKSDDVGRLGLKTLGFYSLTSLLAILTGLLVVNVIQPGIDNGSPVADALALSANTSGMLEKVAGRGMGDIVDIFLRMVPTNVIQAAAQGQMLGLIVFSLLFGFFMTRITSQHS